MTKDEALKMAIEFLENPFATGHLLKTEVIDVCKAALNQKEQYITKIEVAELLDDIANSIKCNEYETLHHTASWLRGLGDE